MRLIDESILAPLLNATGNRGAASVAVIARAGAAPVSTWVPDGGEEPAFLAYSITKSFVAALVLLLAEDGWLALDDRLAKWFPAVARASDISLRQLLNHTAGIPDYGGIRAYHDGVKAAPTAPWSFQRFAEETFAKGLAFEPGSGWGYSNPGYMLLKAIVERVHGSSLRDAIARRITGPLELTRTFVVESIGDLGTLAPALSTAMSPDGSVRDVRMHYHPGWVSHGVVASTATDIARFFDALFGERLFSRESLHEMTRLVAVYSSRPALSPGSEDGARNGEPSYGLGLMGDPASSFGLLLGHNGGGPGYNASAFHAPALDGATVCAMSAIEDVNTEDVTFAAFGLLRR